MPLLLRLGLAPLRLPLLPRWVQNRRHPQPMRVQLLMRPCHDCRRQMPLPLQNFITSESHRLFLQHCLTEQAMTRHSWATRRLLV